MLKITEKAAEKLIKHLPDINKENPYIRIYISGIG